MFKKLFFLSTLLQVNAFIDDSMPSNTTIIYSQPKPRYIYLSFDNITAFRDKKGNFYNKVNNAILYQNNIFVVFLDRNGRPINNEIVTTDFIIRGYFKKIIEFKDINNNLYFVRTDNSGKIRIFDSNNNIVKLNDKNGNYIKI